MQDNIQIRTLLNWFQYETCIWQQPAVNNKYVEYLSDKVPKSLKNSFNDTIGWIKEEYELIMDNGATLTDEVLNKYLYVGMINEDTAGLFIGLNDKCIYEVEFIRFIMPSYNEDTIHIFPYNPTHNMYMYLSGTMTDPCRYQLYYVNKVFLIDNKYIISGNNKKLIKDTIKKMKKEIKDDRVTFAIVDTKAKKVYVDDKTYIYHYETNTLDKED